MTRLRRPGFVVFIIVLFCCLTLSSFDSSQINNDPCDDMVDGIDVSHWQGSIDWSSVYDDSIRFCFTKATEGVGYTDAYFETNMIQGSNEGVYMGPYHFATPTSDDAADEATYFVSVISPYLTEGFLRPVLDLEQGAGLGVETLSNWVHVWMQTVENLTGVEPLIYVNSNYANNYLDESVAVYDLWIAHWTFDPNQTPDTGIWDTYEFWQYSNQGTINGITGDVDLDVFNGNMSDLQLMLIDENMVFVDDDADPSWYDETHVKTIQQGIDNATSNDTVFVYNGTYVEQVLIDKSIRLIGEHQDSTIIDGGQAIEVVKITSDNVEMCHFTITNSSDDGNGYGLHIIHAHHCFIHQNKILQNFYGLQLSYSSNNTINNNDFSYANKYGLRLFESSNDNVVNENTVHSNFFDGLEILNSDRNIIANNSFENNTQIGIRLYASGGDTSQNILIGNNICNNTGGIQLNHADDTSISTNVINDNEYGAVFIHSMNTTICKNMIYDNDEVGIGTSVSENTIVDDNQIYNNVQAGIFLDRESNSSLSNNLISTSVSGIEVTNSKNLTLSENTICFNTIGVRLNGGGPDDILMENSTLNQNMVSNNSFVGILLEYNCVYTVVDGNTVRDNSIGIWLRNHSFNNTIVNNTLFDNAECGVNITDNAANNLVFHNNFINNSMNAHDANMSGNLWDNDVIMGGNYWDDYNGTDVDGDGIGESMYSISGGFTGDYYPFIEENGWLKSIEVNQDVFNRGFPIRHAIDGDWAGAQSMMITSDTITRFDLYVRKFGSPEFDLKIELRKDSIDGALVESFVIPFSFIESSWQWLNMDIMDFETNNDTQYFIVIPPAPIGVTTSFGYEWGYAFGNQYDDGSFWFTRDGGALWRDLPAMYEFIFRCFTYAE